MSFRKRLALFLIFLLVAGALNALFAPFLVAHGVRLWIFWAAKKQGLSAEIEKVEAPFWRPVTIHHLSLAPAEGSALPVNLQAATLMVDLNFRGWLFDKDVAFLRSVTIDRLVGSIRVPEHAAAIKELDWRQLAQLTPENFRVDDLDFDLTTATTSISLRGVVLGASAIEAGKFFARQISITSPFLRQTFSDLRGATSWEGSRLTIAGIPLAPGLDLESLALDLSHLARRRVGIDLHLDTYGGTMRASFEGRAREKFVIDVAGSTSNISLAQIARAFGFLEPITGAVHASKFTFRGNPGEFLDATASIWMELTDFSWRARRADSVMLGATYYGRRLEVDQLYVRQRQNELTINGELLWSRQKSRWAQLPFRGLLNATIPDLNGFAQLFGATTGDFTGALLADGEIDALAPEAHGRLAFHGQEVKFRGVALDSLGAVVALKGTEARFEKLEARHAEDFLRGEGTIDLAAPHHFSGRLTGAINDLGAYVPVLPASWRSSKIAGGATFDWRGDGTLAAHSGTMQLFAHGLQLPVAPLRQPIDLTLEGSYSPQDIFCRTFRVANERVSLGAFLMLGSNFVELQALQLALDGTPRVTGTLFLPFGFNRWRTSRSLLAALDEEQKFDVDLAVDQLDLGAVAEALGEKSTIRGVLKGKLAAFGPLRSLQVTSNWHLAQIGASATSNSIDFEGRYAEGRAGANATALFGASAPLTARASLPLRLEKSRLEAGTVLDRAAPLSVAIECPALFLQDLPNDLQFGARRGLLSGAIDISGSAGALTISGEAQILEADFDPPAPWPELTGLTSQIRFTSSEAVIDPLTCEIGSTPTRWVGRLTTTLSTFGLTLAPVNDSIEVASLPPAGANLSSIRMLGAGTRGGETSLRELLVRGRFASSAASLTIKTENSGVAAKAISGTTLFLNPSGESGSPLLLRKLEAPRPERLQLAIPAAR